MGYHKGCPVAGQVFERLLHYFLALVVQGGGGFIRLNP